MNSLTPTHALPEGYLSIEEYIYRRDPCRSTTFEPLPYPITSSPAPPDITQRVEACRTDILNILQQDGFPSVHLLRLGVENITKPEYPHGHKPIMVLRLVYMFAESVPMLSPTKNAVYDLIRQRGIRNVHVEIVFLDKCFRPSLFSIRSSDEAVLVYAAAKRTIMEFINSQLGTRWNLISLFSIGLTKATATPCIVVYVDPYTRANWSLLTSQVKALLPVTSEAGNANIKPNVEFLPGKISMLPLEPDHNGVDLSPFMREDGIPEPGTSIGVLPERGGGSLGPLVTLSRQGKTWYGALTSFQVVRPPSADQDTRDNAARSVSSIDISDPTKVAVSYFAEKDKESTAYGLEKAINDASIDLRDVRHEKEMRELIGARIQPFIYKTLKETPPRIASNERKLAVVKRMPLELGRVVVSSGRGLLNNRIADWAIVGLHTEPFHHQRSNLLNRMPDLLDNQRPTTEVYNPGDVIHDFGDLIKDHWYCKSGRTTGVTTGTCNGISTYCNWPEDTPIRYAGDGKEASIQNGITEEWVITSESRSGTGWTQGLFCLAGDSGSGIINRRGQICGLLYGSAWGLCGNSPNQISGLCSTMSDIRRWIKEKTTPKDGKGNPKGPGAILGLPQPDPET